MKHTISFLKDGSLLGYHRKIHKKRGVKQQAVSKGSKIWPWSEGKRESTNDCEEINESTK